MEILSAVLKCLNDHNGLIIAVATIVLVGVTWRYVHLTGKLVKAANTPEIALYLKRGNSSVYRDINHRLNYELILCVENIGTGAARNIKFKFDLNYKYGDNNPLENIKLLDEGIKYMAPNHNVSEKFTIDLWGISEDDISEADRKEMAKMYPFKHNPVSICVEYTGSGKEPKQKYCERFDLDLVE